MRPDYTLIKVHSRLITQYHSIKQQVICLHQMGVMPFIINLQSFYNVYSIVCYDLHLLQVFEIQYYTNVEVNNHICFFR